MASFEWTVSPEQAFVPGYDAWVAKARITIKGLADYYAAQIETWMKANAKWEDQTGNARQTLHTAVETSLTETVIYMMHGMDYGIWLEIANSGRFAIIAPAVDHFGPQIIQSMREVFG